MTAWKSRIQKDTVECMIKISATQIDQVDSGFIYLKNYIAYGFFLILCFAFAFHV